MTVVSNETTDESSAVVGNSTDKDPNRKNDRSNTLTSDSTIDTLSHLRRTNLPIEAASGQSIASERDKGSKTRNTFSGSMTSERERGSKEKPRGEIPPRLSGNQNSRPGITSTDAKEGTDRVLDRVGNGKESSRSKRISGGRSPASPTKEADASTVQWVDVVLPNGFRMSYQAKYKENSPLLQNIRSSTNITSSPTQGQTTGGASVNLEKSGSGSGLQRQGSNHNFSPMQRSPSGRILGSSGVRPHSSGSPKSSPKHRGRSINMSGYVNPTDGSDTNGASSAHSHARALPVPQAPGALNVQVSEKIWFRGDTFATKPELRENIVQSPLQNSHPREDLDPSLPASLPMGDVFVEEILDI